LLEQCGATDERDRGEDEVDEERPAPRLVRGQDAPEQQADATARAEDRAVDAERPAPLGPIGERRGQQRQDRRCEDGAEHALHPTGRDQHPEGGCGAANGGRTGEADQADEKHALAPESIRQPPAEKQ
jgi:hypothetical protein